MRLAFTAPFDVRNIHKRSGTPFHMAQAMEKADIELDYISPLKTYLPPGFKLKRLWQQWTTGQLDSSRINTFTAKKYAEQVKKKLTQLKVQGIITHIPNPIAYLDTHLPLILWTDVTYAGLLGFNPELTHHSVSAVQDGNAMTQEFFSRCKLAMFSSDWAARSALELYGVSKEKVKVVPFGANIECNHTLNDIHAMLKKRQRHTVKLLFIGRAWELKGGETVFNVAKALHAAGQPVELNFVGCYPPKGIEIPSYIKCHGFISKSTQEGLEKLTRLLQESHFLFVPSRSEAFGIVFCEANAYGLPCLTTYVGGISTIIKDHINGMTFGLHATPSEYCNYIIYLMQNYSRYEEMALSAFHEYETRLNWRVAVQEAKRLITDIL